MNTIIFDCLQSSHSYATVDNNIACNITSIILYCDNIAPNCDSITPICSRSYSTLSVASSRSSLISETPQLLGGTETPEPGIPVSPNQIIEGEEVTSSLTNDIAPSDANQSEGVGTGKEVTSQVGDENNAITSSLANETAETASQELPEISIQSEMPEGEIISSAANQNQEQEIITSPLANQTAEKQEEDDFGDFQGANAEVVASQDATFSEPSTIARDEQLPEPPTAEATQERGERLGREETGSSQESGSANVGGGGEDISSGESCCYDTILLYTKTYICLCNLTGVR